MSGGVLVEVDAADPAQVDALIDGIRALGHSDGVARVAVSAEGLAKALQMESVRARFVCDANGVRAGFVLFSWKWGTFTGVRDLYVHALWIDPVQRRRGLARAAFESLAELAHASGAFRMEWLAVRANADGGAFYDALGATTADHMVVRRLTVAR